MREGAGRGRREGGRAGEARGRDLVRRHTRTHHDCHGKAPCEGGANHPSDGPRAMAAWRGRRPEREGRAKPEGGRARWGASGRRGWGADAPGANRLGSVRQQLARCLGAVVVDQDAEHTLFRAGDTHSDRRR